MLHEEIELADRRYLIRASLKKPKKCSKVGIVLAHGAIINRQSLIRTSCSLGDYLCNKLGAYVIAPDFNGETIHNDSVCFEDFCEIYNITSKFLVESYNLDLVMGFGHSMGCFIIAESLDRNPYLDSLVNYGGPIYELSEGRRGGFIEYLVNYLSTFGYGVNVRNLMKYVFDSETMSYLEEVMMCEEEYNCSSYDFNFKPEMFSNARRMIEEYLENIKKWNKPTMLAFGTEDKLTKKTIKHYKNNYEEDNIIFKHLENASHVTPCMQSIHQLSKLEPVIDFYKLVHKIEKPNNILQNKITR
jgi:hypothetical protein